MERDLGSSNVEEINSDQIHLAKSAPAVPMENENRGERDFIDSEPVGGSDYESETDTEDESYTDEEYNDLDNASLCTKIYSKCLLNFWSLRWYARSRGGARKPGRLLHRDNAFSQCSGRLHVGQKASRKTKGEILGLYGDDWFHVVLSWPTWKLVLVLISIYTTNLLVFGAFYVAVDRPGQDCGLAASSEVGISYQTAFAFSLITSSTIGYGFPNDGSPFFHSCPELVIVVYFQVVVSLLINALVVGLVLQRLGRADNRSHQVVFSDKACIRCIHGHFYFMFQVFDLDRRHPVVEAHVRCYAAFHETDGTNTVHFQTRYMRLQNPNDELGGVLFLSVPCTVVHCIDQWSPLMPPRESRSTWENVNDDFVHNSSNRYVFPGLVLREADSECGNRDGTSCPVCGESFPTDQHLLRHIRYMQWEEKMNGITPMLRKVLQPSKLDSFEETGEPSDERYLPDQAKAALGEHQRRRPSTGPEDLATPFDSDITTAVEETASTTLESSPAKNEKREAESSHQRTLSSHTPRRTKSHKERATRSYNSTTSSCFTKGVRVGQPTKVNRMLKYYADLSLPIAHQDVDMNLLPTEVQVVPDKDSERRRRNTQDVFSLFEQMEREQQEKQHAENTSQANWETSSNGTTVDNESTINAPPTIRFRPKTKNVDDFRRAIEDHVETSGIEIIVLVEGIEARSSNTFQARHSYTADDIEFDKFFAPCMRVSPSGHAQVNLNSFHQMVPVPSYVSEAIVQSHT